MCRSMGSNFHDWVDYHGVVIFKKNYYNKVAHFRDFGGQKIHRLVGI